MSRRRGSSSSFPRISAQKPKGGRRKTDVKIAWLISGTFDRLNPQPFRFVSPSDIMNVPAKVQGFVFADTSTFAHCMER